MSDFRKLRMTAKGRELLALVHQGTGLQLLNIVIGNGTWLEENQSGEPPADLVNQKKVVAITAIEQTGEVAKAKGMLTNSGLTQGFAITEIGVTALHPVDGEILYMADYCDVAMSSYIPDNTGSPVEMPLDLTVLVSSSQDVTLTINDRFFSATKKDIKDHDADPDAHNLREDTRKEVEDHDKEQDAHGEAFVAHNNDADAHANLAAKMDQDFRRIAIIFG